MSGAGIEKPGYLGALPKLNKSSPPAEKLEEPKSPTSKYFVDEAAARLEKEERAAILAQWKREHDERERSVRLFRRVVTTALFLLRCGTDFVALWHCFCCAVALFSALLSWPGIPEISFRYLLM